MSDDDKTRTTRLRRIAERQGFRLVKSRRRDPRALTYGRWHVVDKFTGKPVAGHGRAGSSWTLDQVEAWLTTRPMELSPHLRGEGPGTVHEQGAQQ